MPPMALIACPECKREISDKATACPHCGCPIVASPPPVMVASQIPPQLPQQQASPTVRAKIVKQSSSFGAGCMVQALGLVSLLCALLTIFSGIGPFIFGPIGVLLLIWGGRLAIWLECSACGSKIAHRRVSICPSCRANFY